MVGSTAVAVWGALVRIDSDQDHGVAVPRLVGWGIRGRQVDFKNLSQHLVVTPLLSQAANEGWEDRQIPGKSTTSVTDGSRVNLPSLLQYATDLSIRLETGAFDTSRRFRPSEKRLQTRDTSGVSPR